MSASQILPRPDDARVIWDAPDVSRALRRIAAQIVEANRGTDNLVLLGIPTRGAPLAQRLGTLIATAEGADVPVGELDITLYRDDLRRHPTRPVGRTRVPASIDGATVVLVDDVLYSGRTIAAAMDALKDLGRPRAVRLAVLIDRGHRELPIQADHVGKDLPTAAGEHVRVSIAELDGTDAVTLVRSSDQSEES
ncbi:bifunctional pyr operon transcriptional regulator/uracil phosphoribosyltransferase PyrR [Propioniciclava sp.]|uniref:bifunctional pyr operon transcriptional regulator/uracil phosphoribosyltransferase PyrR n=1 Tax=Propioniciclava sp. TaxID=2038686 RepID=UPI002611E733|nr:bifunctional pyr operon transcriptional regulator/uracil phosphoribosyltransferase PyrR [Propioniciclava sp.]